MEAAITIDGLLGEGGGQIIRTALSVAAIRGMAVEIVNIRARRPKPGLQPQHLAAVRAAAEICNAEVSGAAVGSSRLLFAPRSSPVAGAYRWEIGTAGAATLVAQTVLAPLALAAAPSRITVLGGTHVPFAPTAEFLEWVYLPVLRHAGCLVQFQYQRAGFYPKGGGELSLAVEGSWTPRPFTLVERGKLHVLTATIITANLPAHVGERGAETVTRFMRGIGWQAMIVRRELPSSGPGAAVVINAEYDSGAAGFSALGERGKPMEQVAEEACRHFLHWWQSGAACDAHLGDQLALPAALAAGESRWSVPLVTDHLRTVLEILRQSLPIEVHIEEPNRAPAIITVRGTGTQT